MKTEIENRKIYASTKETPHCFGWCLTVGDVEEVLEIQKQKILKIIKEWDVEPCCHGIMQDELIRKIKEEIK